MRILTKAGLAAVYLAGWLGTAGALNADLRGGSGKLTQGASHAAGYHAMAVGMAMLPPIWLLSPFMTGFYYHGWTLRRSPLPCTETDEIGRRIWCEEGRR